MNDILVSFSFFLLSLLFCVKSDVLSSGKSVGSFVIPVKDLLLPPASMQIQIIVK